MKKHNIKVGRFEKNPNMIFICGLGIMDVMISKDVAKELLRKLRKLLAL